MSEFRKDPVTGDWVVLAPDRGKRPKELRKNGEAREVSSRENCPFEDLEKSGNWPPIELHPSDATSENWEVAVIPNKYPALVHDSKCAEEAYVGLYKRMAGVGRHELVITRSHRKSFAHLSPQEADQLLEVFQGRYKAAKEDECLCYVSIFANWGEKAGATVYHPHYQILSLPVVPADVMHSLQGSKQYYQKHGECVHCAMLEYELKQKKRIVAENEKAVALAPFFSRSDYEIRIFPKEHISFFETTKQKIRKAAADLLREALVRIEQKLGDPDYNFFIHTSPVRDQKDFKSYHWHIEVLPHTATEGGFELSTGMDINVAAPEDVAKILRS